MASNEEPVDPKDIDIEITQKFIETEQNSQSKSQFFLFKRSEVILRC